MRRRRRRWNRKIFWLMVFIALVIVGGRLGISAFGWQSGEEGRRISENSSVLSGLSETPETENSPMPTPTPELVGESEVEGNFYYSQMNERQQLAYRQIVAAIENGEMEAECPVKSENAVQKVFQGVIYDYPEFFWISEDYTIYNINEGERFEIKLNYNIEESQLAEMKEQVDAVCQSFFDTILADADTYTRVRMAYEYLVTNTEYQTESEQNQNIQSVFLQHSSVCAGYTKAFKYLLNKMDIPCLVVYGSIADSGQKHSWNIVDIDGLYYEIDCTWGEAMDGTDRIVYDYFCITTEEMNRDHVPSKDYSYPECTDRTRDYYINNGTYMVDYDAQQLEQCMLDSALNGEAQTYMKFADEEVYALAKQGIESGQLSEAAARQKM